MFGRSSSTVKGALAVQKLKTPGTTAKLSFSQVVFIISNVEDAKKNLSPVEYSVFEKLFQTFRSNDTLFTVDLDGYHEMSRKIIDAYEEYFPYMLVNGITSMNLEIRDQLRIRKLYNDGLSYWDACPKFLDNRQSILPAKIDFLEMPHAKEVAKKMTDFAEDFFFTYVAENNRRFSDLGYVLGLADAMYFTLYARNPNRNITMIDEDPVTLYITVHLASLDCSNASIDTVMQKRKEISAGHSRYFSDKSSKEIIDFVYEYLMEKFPITASSEVYTKIEGLYQSLERSVSSTT